MTLAARTLVDDDFDRALVRAVHPRDWTNPKPQRRYNLVVIGGGTAGLVAAIGAASLGARVALVERELLGGDCLNVGCVPSKAVIRAARAAYDARTAGEYGVSTGEVEVDVDFAAAMRRMRRIRAGIAPHDSAARLRELGVDVFLGQARFVAEDAINVDGHRLRFARAAIATGARPSAPQIPGLAQYLTNETVFALTERPRHLAVIGAGPIGCELAQAFRRLGSAVTLIDRGDRLLPKDDADAAEVIRSRFVAEGIELRLGANIVRAEPDSTLVLDRGSVRADQILVATGRTPNLEGLELAVAGIDATERGVVVDDHLRTTNRRVFAAGDIASRYQFTHAADAMARVVIQNALFFGRKRVSVLIIPWCTYTDPEVAHVGAMSGDITLTVPLTDVDRAVLDGETEGFARVHADRKGRILGATLVSRHAGESIGELVLAMQHGIRLGALASTIQPYPTQAEAIRKLGDAYQRTRLTPRVRRWFEILLRWRRR